MAQILSLIPAVLVWAGVVYKLPAYRRNRHDPAVRAFWRSLFFLALALTVLVPSIAQGVDRIVGVPNLSRLLGNGMVLLAAWAVQIFTFHSLNYRQDAAESRVRLASWSLVGALVAMTCFFVLAPVHREAAEFWQVYSRAPFMVEYRLVYLAYIALAVVNIVRHSWYYAGIARQPSLALGLRLVAIGGLLGGLYVAHEGLRAASVTAGFHVPILDSDTVTRVLIAGSVALMVAGVTMPAWGPRFGVPTLYRWMDRYRAYRKLYPLWHALYRASPEIALLPPRSTVADAVAIRDMDFRLYRRVVEIRDGTLALRPYVDPRIVERARELCLAAKLPEEEVQATVEAAAIATGLQTRKYSRPFQVDMSRTASPFESHGGADVTSEAEVLVRVAQRYKRSPIVRTVLAETGNQRTRRIAGTGTTARRG